MMMYSNERPKTLCLPYVKGISERIQRMCRRIGIRTVFSAKRTLKSLLTKVKGRPPIEQAKGVVYEVSCEFGETYIGETGRTLGARLREHKYAVSRWDTTNGIALHANTHNHWILWEQTRVVEKESFWTKTKIKL